VSNFW